jgi:predicted RNA-binding Zn-ribbon protein involved in translation (DUF1610 family)
MTRPGVEMGRQEMLLRCECGWEGPESAVTEWDVQFDRDRVVRKCPNCGRPVPEWGAFRSIDGVAQIAKGSIRESLEAAGLYEKDD